MASTTDPTPSCRPAGDEPPADVEALVVELHEAGGRIVVDDPAPRARARWRRLLFAAQGHGAVPDGARVRHTGRDRGDLVVWLDADQAAAPTKPQPVPIPAKVRNPHPGVAALRTAKAGEGGWIDTFRDPRVVHVRVHRSQRARTVLVLHALCTEAVRRGHKVTVDSTPAMQRRHRSGCGLSIVVDGHPFEVAVVEETDRVAHEPTRSEIDRAARNYWIRIPEWDRVPSGRLSLRMGHGAYATQLASDRKRWRLEDRLDRALAKIEAAGAAAAERAQAEVQRRAEEQRRRQQAVEQAEKQWRDAQLRADLEDRAARFRMAHDIRLLVKAAREVGGADEDWLEWAAGEAERLDPTVGGSLTWPDLPAPAPSDLGPFLPASFNPLGWSPNRRV